MRRALLAAFVVGASASASGDLWSLQGRRAVVTGGSKGLGRAIVDELLAQGCDVITCARDLLPLEQLLASEPRLTAVQADVATAEGRRALLDAINERFAESEASPDPVLDLLVNNVGTNLRRASVDYTDEEYALLHETNQASAFHLSRMCFDALRRGVNPSVVSVSSVCGSTVDSTGAPYHMNKAAMEHMTRCGAPHPSPLPPPPRVPARSRTNLGQRTMTSTIISQWRLWRQCRPHHANPESSQGVSARAQGSPPPALCAHPPSHSQQPRAAVPTPASHSPAAQVPGLRMGPCGRARQRCGAVVHFDAPHAPAAERPALRRRRAPCHAAPPVGRRTRGGVHSRLSGHAGRWLHQRRRDTSGRRDDVRGI